MRLPRLAACVVAMGIAGVTSAQIPNITPTISPTTPTHTFTPTTTGTPTHTFTPTSTPTPTATPTPTSSPTNGPTPMPTPWPVLGPEFQVNTTAAGGQKAPSVALYDAGFVIVWVDDSQDGSSWGIFGRRYDRFGTPVSAEFPVATYTLAAQSDPHVASNDNGDFVVAWQSHHTGGEDIFARMFNSNGDALGPEFMVNTDTQRFHTQPDIAMGPNGGFVVVWTSENTGGNGQDGSGAGVFGRIYDGSGSPLGGEFQVNTYTTGDQTAPSVSMSPYGSFVIVWQSDGQDGSLSGIYGQSFDGAAPSGSEFPVNTATAAEQITPDVAMNETGILATWASKNADGSDFGISARLFDTSAAPLGNEFQVNSHTEGIQVYPSVAAARQASAFIVAWQSYSQEDPTEPLSGIYAQRFENKPLSTAAFYLAYPPRAGSEFQINTYTTGGQTLPALAIDIRGQFVIAWGSAPQDADGYGVFARRFGWPDPRFAKVDERASGGASNVNGVLEPGERVTMDPTWSTRQYPSSVTLAGTASNFTGPPGPVYTVEDSSADYGSIPFFGADCYEATGNCYEVSVSGTRPSVHWDATVDELLSSPGPLLGEGAALPRLKTWALHVGQSFSDVPEDGFYPYIENILHNRVTAGGGCGAASFCGEDGVLRQQLAVFVLKALYGAEFLPPPATGAVFEDVPASSPFAPWIEELARQGVVAGCATPPPPALPSYCPVSIVNRQQMAAFLIKATHNGDPTFCGGVFVDVPCDNPFAPYIEALYASGAAAGCQATPELLYCPTDTVKRKQTAPLLVRTFGLQLYGPD